MIRVHPVQQEKLATRERKEHKREIQKICFAIYAFFRGNQRAPDRFCISNAPRIE
ncbi:hypothetical protein SCARR_00627 [Pontiella sulfatireligans]|uniref:Uncharacterized protein n=1 Tax=Pontiella sulfatireligans TaxID=2750658 RepID=A0A6C2UGT1_9BACT|nr:hypothetical protein SCARR_00627 [Pontiella sulfatireligans]